MTGRLAVQSSESLRFRQMDIPWEVVLCEEEIDRDARHY